MFQKVTGFDWDQGNLLKNWEQHGVTHLETEQVFFNEPLIIQDDRKHSAKERRWYGLGRTDTNRLLMIVFTLREHRIRVISARDMSRKERKTYEKET
jgi:uncharacterized DUF497 family protein